MAGTFSGRALAAQPVLIDGADGILGSAIWVAVPYDHNPDPGSGLVTGA